MKSDTVDMDEEKADVLRKLDEKTKKSLISLDTSAGVIRTSERPRESGRIVIDGSAREEEPKIINYEGLLAENEIYPNVKRILESKNNNQTKEQIGQLVYYECKQLEYLNGCSIGKSPEVQEANRKAYLESRIKKKSTNIQSVAMLLEDAMRNTSITSPDVLKDILREKVKDYAALDRSFTQEDFDTIVNLTVHQILVYRYEQQHEQILLYKQKLHSQLTNNESMRQISHLDQYYGNPSYSHAQLQQLEHSHDLESRRQ